MNSIFRATTAGRRSVLALGLAGLLASGCDTDLNVPDYNNPSLENLRDNPTPSLVRSAATGLLIGARANIAGPNQYVSLLGILGRESYNFDGSEPRFVTEMLGGPMSPSGAFGGNLWSARYRNIQNANLLLDAVDQVGGFSAQEKEAIRGFAKTIKAHDLLLVINTRDTNGAVIETAGPIRGAEPGPLESRDRVMARVAQLLDEAHAHLQAGGSAFPFPLSSGFQGFNTPATFARFNRALRARVAVYRRSYDQALQALQGSFVDRSAPLSRGVYHAYGLGTGETSNDLIAITIFAHPSILTDAQRQPDGTLDERVQDKVTEIPPRTVQGFAMNAVFSLYDSPTSPVPIIRNEELLLLRAEARWFTGDRAGAMEDLNFVRQQSGGLAPLGMPANDAAFIDALLYERRYSLLFEGGHRWIDHRRFDRLNQLPRALPSHLVHARFPIPEGECLARGITGECSAGS